MEYIQLCLVLKFKRRKNKFFKFLGYCDYKVYRGQEIYSVYRLYFCLRKRELKEYGDGIVIYCSYIQIYTLIYIVCYYV